MIWITYHDQKLFPTLVMDENDLSKISLSSTLPLSLLSLEQMKDGMGRGLARVIGLRKFFQIY